MKLDKHMLLCVTCVTGWENIQWQGITADESRTGHYICYLELVQPRKAGVTEKLFIGIKNQYNKPGQVILSPGL